MSEDHTLDLAAIRARLGASTGRETWRSLEELADSPGFQEIVQREFPSRASEWLDPVGRRSFLKLMGASLALAGVTACTRQPIEQIVPYVTQPEEIILGKPLYFATAMTLGGIATGVLVKSNEGRPTKIEGNVFHPESQGATSVFGQGSVLSLYDPDRTQSITYLGDTRSWNNFVGAFQGVLRTKTALKGAGIRILTETVSSPTLADQFKDVLAAYPDAQWHQYEQTGREHVREGAKQAFGRYVETQYHFDKADVILSLGADFLSGEPGTLRYVRDFSNHRRVAGPDSTMNRLYVVEPMLTNTGAMADHRWPLRPSQIAAFSAAVASGLGVAGVPPADAQLPQDVQSHVASIVKDLQAHKGSSIVIAGNEQPAELHVLAHAINAALGNVGSTVVYTDPVEANPVNQIDSIRTLVADIDAGKVDVLVIIGANPVYNAPADLQFADKLQKVALRIHMSQRFDETSGLCHWHIPETHYLEAWSDGRAYDGTVSIVQPLIAPLYNAKSAHEMLAAMTDQPSRGGYEIVRSYWARQFRQKNGGGQNQAGSGNGGGNGAGSGNGAGAGSGNGRGPQRGQGAGRGQAQDRGQGAESGTGQSSPAAGGSGAIMAPLGPTPPAGDSPFDLFWRKVLNDGVMPDTAFAPVTVTLATTLPALPKAPAESDGLEFVMRLDPTTYDGRFANNGWLQELPKPITRLTWDNAVLLSPATAERFGIGLSYSYQGGEHGQAVVDTVELTLDGRKVTAPVWIMPGQADNCATIYLGYGRTGAGNVGNHTGYNGNVLRTTKALWSGAGLKVAKNSTTYAEKFHLATVQDHFSMQGRGFVQAASIEEYRRNPDFAPNASEAPPTGMTMYNPAEFPYNDYKWSMAIDLNACTGCGACVIACVAENNIAVVGKDQVMAGREMHWIRVDRYFEGSLENPTVYNQPVPCQQCENAPCELVCPVGATVHSSEGLNDMVYNRCVGTRYCSNNCPYKVRRFNFLLYQDWTTQPLKFVRNPDVSVRSRGVMEKCTYCVQRIQEAKIDSEKQNRKVRDGEIVTACQAVCPTEAIVFGDANDKTSRVAKLKAQSRNYGLLAELNTHPRTTYLAALRNPNPEIAPLATAASKES